MYTRVDDIVVAVNTNNLAILSECVLETVYDS